MNYIAMDCGGTKLAVVVNIAGVATQSFTKPGVSHGTGDLTKNLIAVINDALSEVNKKKFDVIGISLAAIPDSFNDRAKLIVNIKNSVHVKDIFLISDSKASYYSCATGDDMVIAIGTGITAIYRADSKLVEISGHGYRLGDEASAYWIGKEGLNQALKYLDGRGQPTSLINQATDYFGASYENLSNVVHQASNPNISIAGFAREVITAAKSGDAISKEILNMAANEIWEIINSAKQKTKIKNVKLIGGMIANDDYYSKIVTKFINKKDRKLQIETPSSSAINGVENIIKMKKLPSNEKDLHVYITEDFEEELEYDDEDYCTETATNHVSERQNAETESLNLESHRDEVTLGHNSKSETILGAKDLGASDNRYAPAAANRYFAKLIDLLKVAVSSNQQAMNKASEMICQTLVKGGLIHTFGTGHSHLLAEEIFYRAGGLAPIYPILDERLMLHKDVVSGSQNERLPNLANDLLAKHPINKNDTIIIISNSGGNQVSIDIAVMARELGAGVIVLTSLNTASSSKARAQGGMKLHQYADVVLDNAGVVGDALVNISGVECNVGPTSTAIGAALLQAVVVGAVELLKEKGH